jgi:hypothetical protein
MLSFWIRREDTWERLNDAHPHLIRWLRNQDRIVREIGQTTVFRNEDDAYVKQYKVFFFRENKRAVYSRRVILINGEECELVRTTRNVMPTRAGFWRP